MPGHRGSRDPFFDFGDPFTAFGGFGTFRPPRSLLSNFFGGRDPFDDPFFTRPRPFGSMFQSTPFGPSGDLFPLDMHPSGFLERQAPEPRKSRGPIIEELNSDDEKKDTKEENKESSRKRARSENEPSIQYPEDEAEGKRNKYLQHENECNRFNDTRPQPRSHSFSFHSSTVTYGGVNGTYYTSSRTRRTGSDGVTFEDCKEADSATGQASHTISRGLHSQGNSLSRKLNSNGKVETMQTLFNLNEDELPAFEEAWKGKAQKYLPEWTGNIGGNSSAQDKRARQGGWALPSAQHSHSVRNMSEVRDEVGSSTQERARMEAHASDRSAYHQRWQGRK